MTIKSLDDIRKQLEELRARAALPALSAEEQERASAREELAKLKGRIEVRERQAREAREDDLFEELEGKHAGETLHRIDAVGGMIVMRAPSYAKSRVFQQVALKGKLGPDAIEEFVKPCVVYPDAEELEERLETSALLGATLCQIAQEIGSDEAKRHEKKS